MQIERHFVTLDGKWGPRQVHYRRCGSGPAVLLLHQSPQSAHEYEGLMVSWAADFTVIAPDHPGYGLSDSLDTTDASLEDFADALAEFLVAINVEKTSVYGFHTGAGMAVALGARHPNLISAAFANGYVVLSDSEREHILSEYLPPFVPQWDGGHLIWIWSRNRDQVIYFPWFDRRAEARMAYTLPDPQILQRWLIEFLRAGDNYRVAYNAAFNFRGEAPLVDMQVPTIVTSVNTDVLSEHLAKITETSEQVDVHMGGTLDENLAEAQQFFRSNPGQKIPAPSVTESVTGQLWNRVVPYVYGQLRVIANFDGNGEPVLLVHGAGRSAANLTPLMNALRGQRPVIALDLPGHGESDAMPDDTTFLDAVAAALDAVLDAFGLQHVDAWGEWGGSTALIEYARRHPDRLRHIAVSGAQFFSSDETQDLIVNYAPEIKPLSHGGHLLECWHRVRNESLFWPWYREESGSVISGMPRLDAEDLTQRFLALLQSAPDQARIHRELFAYPLADSLAENNVKILLTAATWDPNKGHTEAAAANSQSQFVLLPDRQKDWVPTLLEFFNQ